MKKAEINSILAAGKSGGAELESLLKSLEKHPGKLYLRSSILNSPFYIRPSTPYTPPMHPDPDRLAEINR